MSATCWSTLTSVLMVKGRKAHLLLVAYAAGLWGCSGAVSLPEDGGEGASEEATVSTQTEGGQWVAVNSQRLTMGLSGPAVADGTSDVEVSLYFEDSNGAPVSGVQPELSLSSSDSTRDFIRSCEISDGFGFARCRIASTLSGSKTVSLIQPFVRNFQEALVFVHGPAAQISVIEGVQDSNADSGFPGDVVVEVQDAFGNRVDSGPDSVAPIRIGSMEVQDRLDGAQTVSAVSGIARFSNVAYRTSGAAKKIGVRKLSTADQAVSRSVTSGGITLDLPVRGSVELQSESRPFAVNAGNLNELQLSDYPSEVIAGVPLSLDVLAKDRYGNTIETGLDAIEVTSDDVIAQLPVDVRIAPADSGRKRINQDLSLRGAGQKSITVRHPTSGVVVTTGSIRVIPGEVSELRSEVIPSKTQIQGDGTDESVFQVILRDQFGNPVPGASVGAETSRPDGDQIIGAGVYSDGTGTATVRIRSHRPGVSNIAIHSGAKTIGSGRNVQVLGEAPAPQSSSSPSPLSSATPTPSSAPSSEPALARLKLEVLSQPSSATVSEVFPSSFQVALQDEAGITLRDRGATVHLSVYSGSDAACSGSSQSGSLSSSSAITQSGIADFSTLSFDVAGSIRLKATAAGYTSVCSREINVVPAYRAPASFCDQGDLQSTCVLTTPKTLSSFAEMDIRLNRLQINSGGSIVGFTDGATRTCLVIRAEQGIDIRSGGSITVSSKGFASAQTILRNPWEPQEWGSGSSGYGGGCVQLTTPGEITHGGALSAAGGTSAQGGSIWIRADRITGAGAINASGGAGLRGRSSSSSATACNNGPGTPGGDGGAVKIEGITSSFTGSVNVSGGAGGQAGSTGYKCSRPSATGSAASGVNGTDTRFNQTDLIVPSGLTLVLTESIRANLRRATVKSGGKLILSVGDTLDLESITTESSSIVENHGSISAVTGVFGGGVLDNRYGELRFVTGLTVSGPTVFLGELQVVGHLQVNSTFLGGVSDPTSALSIIAGSAEVTGAGVVGTDFAAAGGINAAPLTLSVTGTLNLLGRLSADGLSGNRFSSAGGGDAGSIDLEVGDLTGSGRISAAGGEGVPGNESTATSTSCSNGPGYPGGDGGAITITGNTSGFSGTIDFASGLGGSAGLTGYNCRSPRYSGRAASGAPGSVSYF